MRRRRVKITGIGPVSPAGIGKEAFEDGIFENKSWVQEFNQLDPSLGKFIAGSIPTFALTNYVDRFPGQNGAARHTQLAVAAAALALRDARISADQFQANSDAVLVTGTSLMDCEALKRSYDQVLRLGIQGAYTRAVFSANVASIPATVALALKLRARTLCIQSSCCSGLDAIGFAAREVAEGRAEIALCGGTEAPLFSHPMIELRAAGLMSRSSEDPEKQCRPFDLWRTTGAIAEGACMIVLEPECSSNEGYAYVDGYGFGSDNGNGICSGMISAIESAIADSQFHFSEVDVINAWGPGHRQIDAAEAAALRAVFEEHLNTVAVGSIKGALGSPLGAAGAIQIGAAVIGLRNQRVPPTVNWEMPDPQCNLNLSREALYLPHRRVLVNAHGISGSNSSILLSGCR